MKEIFSRASFSKAPGGDHYEWKEAETSFEIIENGKYIIAIIASAKNAKQNQSRDDDDLRIVIDGYEFGKYEMHDEKVSWKGFGTASAWDGASLKGGTKTSYFFVELQTGKHIITFYADETPQLKDLKIFQLQENEKFEVEERATFQNINVDKKGIPWMSFIFLGVKPRTFAIASMVKSAQQKGGNDGDNLKVVLNGKVQSNQKAPSSKKYKNFYFSGDLNKGKSEVLEIQPEKFEFLEDSVELWYDKHPSVYVQIELSDSTKEWLKKGIPEKTKLKLYESALQQVVRGFSLLRYEYANRFLRYSLLAQPKKLSFENRSSLVNKIKKDKAYQKILTILKNQIRKGILNGQIHLGDEEKGLKIDFKEGDLKWALHGLKKIEYTASKRNNNIYDLEFTLLDVYDFDPHAYTLHPIKFGLHMAEVLEKNLILRNFEIEIQFVDSIKMNYE